MKIRPRLGRRGTRSDEYLVLSNKRVTAKI